MADEGNLIETKESVQMMTSMRKHEDVVNGIKARLDGAEAPVTEERCIYRVPFPLRKVNEDAYSPTLVSIGPYHHNRHPRLQNMEKHKLIYCKAFLEKTQTSLESWIQYIESVEPQIRRCYSETLEFSKEELVNIIFVDSGFILELFLRQYYADWSTEDDDKFLSTPWLFGFIQQDLWLLENQLPFFVLDGLFNLTFTPTSYDEVPSFIGLIFHYFSCYNKSNLSFHSISIKHFTDLIRTFHLQHPAQRRPPRSDYELVKHFPSATELSEAGVRFKVNTDSKCLLDLTFSGRVLEIPQLIVDDETEILLRNMIALEQFHYPRECYIMDYAKVLDLLVNTNKDVDILVRKTVLVNMQGDTDCVANLFNGLLCNIARGNDSSHNLRMCQDLNDFYTNPWNHLKSTLRRDYCKSPWQTAATVAGILLLILSLLQSVCSVLQLIQQ